MSSDTALDNILTGLVAIAQLATVVMHGPAVEKILDYVIDRRCPHCGYRLDHPFVDHKECNEAM